MTGPCGRSLICVCRWDTRPTLKANLVRTANDRPASADQLFRGMPASTVATDLQRLIEVTLRGRDVSFVAQHALRHIARARLSCADGGLVARIIGALPRRRRLAVLRERLAEKANERDGNGQR